MLLWLFVFSVSGETLALFGKVNVLLVLFVGKLALKMLDMLLITEISVFPGLFYTSDAT